MEEDGLMGFFMFTDIETHIKTLTHRIDHTLVHTLTTAGRIG